MKSIITCIAIILSALLFGCSKIGLSKYEGLFTDSQAVYQIKSTEKNKFIIRVFALKPDAIFAECIDDIEYSGELVHDQERKVDYIQGAFFNQKLNMRSKNSSCRNAEKSNEIFRIVLNNNNLVWAQFVGLQISNEFELERVNKNDLVSYSHIYSKL